MNDLPFSEKQMSKFMMVLDTKSRSHWLDPNAVVAVEPAGELACHIVLFGGYKIENVHTSAMDAKDRVEAAMDENDPFSFRCGECACDEDNGPMEDEPSIEVPE